MRHFVLISICLLMTACATVKPETAAIQVRPVMKSSGEIKLTNFNAQSALAAALDFQNQANYQASYESYGLLRLRLKADDEIYPQVLLGLADSALALMWRAGDTRHSEKYETQARGLYEKISMHDNSSKGNKHRVTSGLLLLDLADYTPKVAKKHLTSALLKNPNDPRLWNALGEIHDGNKDWLEALKVYVKALSVAQKNNQSTAAVINNMGMSLLMQGRKKEALNKFKQAKKSQPNMPVYGNNLRLAQTLSDKIDQALNGVNDTRAAQIYNDAGVIAQSQGKTKKAASLYKKAIEISPVYFELAENNLAELGL